MSVATLVSGTILFEGSESISADANVKVILYDVTEEIPEKVFEQILECDKDSLLVFKYLPFEIKGFDLDEDRRYNLSVHIGKHDDIECGDYISTKRCSVKTGLEHFDIPVVKYDTKFVRL